MRSLLAHSFRLRRGLTRGLATSSRCAGSVDDVNEFLRGADFSIGRGGVAATLATAAANESAAAVAWRFDDTTAPLLVGAAAADTLPSELADEKIIGLQPEQLSFVLLTRGSPEPLVSMIDSLWPGAAIVACAAPDVTRFVDAADSEEAAVGALFTDAQKITPFAHALFEVCGSTGDFVANAAASRELFLPSKAACLDASAAPRPDDQDVPCFVLDGMRIAPGESHVFNIFEPRYKSMVKESLEYGRPLLIVDEKDDSVGSLCRVGQAEHDPVTGNSVVVMHCEALAIARGRKTTEFSLVRATALEHPQPGVVTQPRPEPEA